MVSERTAGPLSERRLAAQRSGGPARAARPPLRNLVGLSRERLTAATAAEMCTQVNGSRRKGATVSKNVQKRVTKAPQRPGGQLTMCWFLCV